ncbi:hypothetical protein, partial [Methylophaga muralis]|uniref:hypothetical protein n=1 Tax=Methylophaga muralis TaxID=291169 RepID=UPI001C402E26
MNNKNDPNLRSDITDIGELILGMRDAYAKGLNAMEFARLNNQKENNSTLASLIAYDLQAGSYVAWNNAHPEVQAAW